MRLTIPAREVQAGDTIPGLGLRVALNADSSHRSERILYFGPADPSQSDGSVHLNAGALVEVERTDPDAELIERIAQSLAEADEASPADDAYLEMARAALAIVRADQ